MTKLWVCALSHSKQMEPPVHLTNPELFYAANGNAENTWTEFELPYDVGLFLYPWCWQQGLTHSASTKRSNAGFVAPLTSTFFLLLQPCSFYLSIFISLSHTPSRKNAADLTSFIQKGNKSFGWGGKVYFSMLKSVRQQQITDGLNGDGRWVYSTQEPRWIKHLRIFSNKGDRGREGSRQNQQGPRPRSQDLQRDRDTNLHVKEGWGEGGGVVGGGGLRLLQSASPSLDHKSRCLPAKNPLKESCVDLRRGHHSPSTSAMENPGKKLP